jgi:putative transposase
MSQSARSVYAGYRLPPEIISHAVWLYFRFPLSLRMVEEMLAARGIVVSHETVRQWALKFGQTFANEIRQRLPCVGDKWHLDEVVIKIAGKTHWLWRAVDQHGVVLDVLVQSRRDAKAAKRLLRKLLKRQGRAPRVKITDKLASYPAAKKDLMPGVEHRRHKGLNNRDDAVVTRHGLPPSPTAAPSLRSPTRRACCTPDRAIRTHSDRRPSVLRGQPAEYPAIQIKPGCFEPSPDRPPARA